MGRAWPSKHLYTICNFEIPTKFRPAYTRPQARGRRIGRTPTKFQDAHEIVKIGCSPPKSQGHSEIAKRLENVQIVETSKICQIFICTPILLRFRCRNSVGILSEFCRNSVGILSEFWGTHGAKIWNLQEITFFKFTQIPTNSDTKTSRQNPKEGAKWIFVFFSGFWQIRPKAAKIRKPEENIQNASWSVGVPPWWFLMSLRASVWGRGLGMCVSRSEFCRNFKIWFCVMRFGRLRPSDCWKTWKKLYFF